jgi:hypothetical protein
MSRYFAYTAALYPLRAIPVIIQVAQKALKEFSDEDELHEVLQVFNRPRMISTNTNNRSSSGCWREESTALLGPKPSNYRNINLHRLNRLYVNLILI